MNYIHQLQKDKAGLQAQVFELEEALRNLKAYVLSSKFRCGDKLDYYVSTHDITARVDETLRRGDEARREVRRHWQPKPKRKRCTLTHETDWAAYNCGCYE